MKKILIAAFVAAGMAQTAFAADAAKGKEIFTTKGCTGCHGPAGVSATPIWPNLAGQKDQYIVLALKAYKAKERSSANAQQMYPFAGQLSETDMADVAAFLSGLK